MPADQTTPAMQSDVKTHADIMAADFIQRHLFGNPRYQDPKRLNRSEFSVYSQGGEDGIIQEIFSRIGCTNRFFVEFGVGDGLENNTAYLLLNGWSGVWLEGNRAYVQLIQRTFQSALKRYRLVLREAFITAENIEALFTETNAPAEFDLLSIDIDGNDFWVWEAITNFRPRVVAMEYNAAFPPPSNCVMRYNPQHTWRGTTYFNASLKALEVLGAKKGYRLVGCSFTGVNAFFVREDLAGDKFLGPYTAENHYEPARYFLVRNTGLPKDFGEFVLGPQ